MQPLTIQPAQLGDVDDLVRIETEAFSAPWTRAMFEAELTGNPFSAFFIARPHERNDRSEAPIGYLCGWIVFEEFRLMTLAVERSWLRRGVASALLWHGLVFAHERGGLRALLEVRASNTGAQTLYGRFGFRQQGVRRHYYTNPEEDAILMALDPIQVSEKQTLHAPMVH